MHKNILLTIPIAARMLGLTTGMFVMELADWNKHTGQDLHKRDSDIEMAVILKRFLRSRSAR